MFLYLKQKKYFAHYVNFCVLTGRIKQVTLNFRLVLMFFNLFGKRVLENFTFRYIYRYCVVDNNMFSIFKFRAFLVHY